MPNGSSFYPHTYFSLLTLQEACYLLEHVSCSTPPWCFMPETAMMLPKCTFTQLSPAPFKPFKNRDLCASLLWRHWAPTLHRNWKCFDAMAVDRCSYVWQFLSIVFTRRAPVASVKILHKRHRLSKGAFLELYRSVNHCKVLGGSHRWPSRPSVRSHSWFDRLQ